MTAKEAYETANACLNDSGLEYIDQIQELIKLAAKEGKFFVKVSVPPALLCRYVAESLKSDGFSLTIVEDSSKQLNLWRVSWDWDDVKQYYGY